MQENILRLQKEFERIKRIGWIKERRKGKCASGYTLESLLGKKEDDFPLPDYAFIEIKTMNDNTKTNLHLFNLTPDGDYLFPIKRVLNELGCPSKTDKQQKVFYKSFLSTEYTKIIYGMMGRIVVNREKKKVILDVINNKLKKIDIGISWSFEYLRERLSLKLNYLAVVRVSSCIINGEGYYHYHKIDFYKLKDFETFLSLVEKGIIIITFKIGTHKSGPKKGEIYDHGTDFSIDIKNIGFLYNKING